MKHKCTYIDSQYFCREYEDQGIIILFKKWSIDEDTKHNIVCNDILKIITEEPSNLSVSDILNQGNWEENISGLIQDTLFVQHYNDSIIAADISKRFCGRYDEIYEGNIMIAKISRTNFNLSNIFLYVLLAFFICYISYIIIDKKRIKNNQIVYFEDREKIGELDSLYKESIYLNHSYSTFLNNEKKEYIKKCIDSLSQQSKDNYLKSLKKGHYTHVASNEILTLLKDNISQLVENARKIEQEEIESLRIKGNEVAYNNDRRHLYALYKYVSDSISIYSSNIGEERKRVIKDLLKITDHEHGLIVNSNSGNYLSHQNEIDSTEIWIRFTADSLHRDYIKNKRNARKKILRKRMPESINNNQFTYYKELIDRADFDYKKYYNEDDIAAARRAYINYNEALKIKYDSQVANRCQKLKAILKI